MMKDPQSMGRQLKRRRKEKRFTLEQLALKTGLSASYISKIERGMVNPSAEVIQRLSYALDLTASELVIEREMKAEKSPSSEDSYVLDLCDRALIYEFGNVLSFESLMDENPHFKVNVLSFSGPSNDGMRSVHSHDEFGIVARGTLELTLGSGQVFILREGQAVMIRAQMSHQSRCLSPKGCISYWIEILDK